MPLQGGTVLEMCVAADYTGIPVRGSHPCPRDTPGVSGTGVAPALLRVAARPSRPAVLIPMDDASAAARASAGGVRLGPGLEAVGQRGGAAARRRRRPNVTSRATGSGAAR